jgi:hypothetical protein
MEMGSIWGLLGLRSCLGMLTIVLASSVHAENITLKDFEHNMKTSGPKTVLHEVFSDTTAWNALLTHIATGDPRWVELASTLYRNADGGAREELEMAVGESLDNNPSSILDQITKPGSAFPLSVICSALDIDDPRFEKFESAMTELTRRKKAVSQIAGKHLKEARQRCLTELEHIEPDLRRFFGVESK